MSRRYAIRSVCLGVAVVLVLGGAVVSGCSRDDDEPSAAKRSTKRKSASSSGEESRSAEPTAPPEQVAVAVSGAVSTPAAGSAVRTALTDAARKRTGTSGQYQVLQMVTDGAWAVAALKPVSGGQGRFFAFRNEVPGGWVCFWDAPVGDDAVEAILLLDPRFPKPVLVKVDFRADLDRPTLFEASNEALRIARSTYKEVPAKSARIVGRGQDARGRWWFQAWTDHGSSYENEQWFIYKEGVAWKLATYGTGVERSDLPSDIVWEDVK